MNSVAGYANGETVVLIIDPEDSTKKQTFTGTVDTGGSQITGVVWTAGTNQGHSAGATVVDYATATHISMMTKGILVHADQDGTLKAGAVDTAAVLASNVVTTAKILDDNVTAAKLADDSVETAQIVDENVTSRKLAPTIISETCSADVTTITSEADITGCTTTFTPAIASYAIVWGVFYFNSGSVANDIFYGALNVDTANEAELVRYVVPTSGGGGTFSQVWAVPLTAASHTLKLVAGRTSGTGSAAVRQVHTKLIVWLVGDANVTDS